MDLAIQADGKIVVVGSARGRTGPSRFAVARYLPTGEPDTSFGGDGRVLTAFTAKRGMVPSFGTAVALLPNGKIVAAGIFRRRRFAVVRYLSDGRLDRSFGVDGRVTVGFGGTSSGTIRPASDAYGVAVDPDGRIVAVGLAAMPVTTFSQISMAVARLLPDGRVDRSFSGDGRTTTSFGKFSSDGAFALDVAIDRQGRIVAAGSTSYDSCNEDVAVIRYQPDGPLDRTFSEDGKVITSFATGPADVELNRSRANAVALRKDGRILTAGSGLNEACSQVGAEAGTLTRYRADGRPDAAFGDGGRAVTVRTTALDCWCLWNDLAIDADGGLVLTGEARDDQGNARLAVARTHGDGTLDPSFGDGGWVLLAPSSAETATGFGVALQENGRIVVAGTDGSVYAEDGSAFVVARFLP